MDILEIPNFADMTIKSKDHYGRDRDQWPMFRTQGSDKFITKNCGEYALKELGRLIDKLKGLDAKFYSAKRFTENMT